MHLFVTPRERQILQLLSLDFTSRELAGSLSISFETVKTHRQSLLRKLDVKTTGGLVRKGFELGLLEVKDNTARNRDELTSLSIYSTVRK